MGFGCHDASGEVGVESGRAGALLLVSYPMWEGSRSATAVARASLRTDLSGVAGDERVREALSREGLVRQDFFFIQIVMLRINELSGLLYQLFTSWEGGVYQ